MSGARRGHWLCRIRPRCLGQGRPSPRAHKLPRCWPTPVHIEVGLVVAAHSTTEQDPCRKCTERVHVKKRSSYAGVLSSVSVSLRPTGLTCLVASGRTPDVCPGNSIATVQCLCSQGRLREAVAAPHLEANPGAKVDGDVVEDEVRALGRAHRARLHVAHHRSRFTDADAVLDGEQRG